MKNFNQGFASVNEAFNEGRFHTQRFIKINAQVPAPNTFLEWGPVTGHPMASARVGNPLDFTPLVGSANNSIYFPPIPSTSRRYLASATFRADNNCAYSVLIGDLLGYYPIISGDSTDTQTFNNTLSLPRYQNGQGVIASLVSNVSITTSTGSAEVTYVDSNDVTCKSYFRTINLGLQSAILNVSNTVGAGSTGLGIPADPISSGSGIKRVVDITYTVSPGGIQAIYLWKPLATIVFNSDSTLSREKDFMSHNGMSAPIILDGAYLNVFFQGSNFNQGRFFGDLTFIWT